MSSMKERHRAALWGARRILALVLKETRQTVRDPSSILIALVLPLILLFLYGYGVSLDATDIRLGIALEDSSPEARELMTGFTASAYFDVVTSRDHRALVPELTAGNLKSIVVIPQDFARSLRAGRQSPVQVIADGAETNTAAFVQNYSRGVIDVLQRRHERLAGSGGQLDPAGSGGAVELLSRTWYNPELDSRNSLVPGSLTVIMAIIGTLLTSLVVAREWERGTMEAVLATPLRPRELLAAKIVPYFLLGMLSLMVSTGIAVILFRVPLRGSLAALLATGGAFLLTSLMQGLMISTLAKDQFVASQGALITAFLPAFLLSGFIFEISSMPLPIRLISRVIPARYFVTCLQSIFLAGDIWALFLPAIGYLCALSFAFLVVTILKTPRRVG